MSNSWWEIRAAFTIRSLISLFALAVLYGYFADSRPIPRAIIALSSVPIAILSNGLRIAGTGMAAHYIGPETATGFFHAFSGWAVFMTSFAMMIAVAHLVRVPVSPRGAAPRPELATS